MRMASTGMMSGGSMMTGRRVVACRSMMMVALNSLVRHTGGVMDLGGVVRRAMCSHLASVMGGWSVMSSYMVGAMVSIMVSAVVVMMPTRAIC